MREFRKKPIWQGWKRWWKTLLSNLHIIKPAAHKGGHHRRMQARKRKTKFHRW